MSMQMAQPLICEARTATRFLREGANSIDASTRSIAVIACEASLGSCIRAAGEAVFIVPPYVGSSSTVVEFYTVDIVVQELLQERDMVRTGRRPGDSGTSQAILNAARRQFAERGYDATTIRSIAGEAGVDPALVMHFYGSKDAVFTASVEWPFDPAEEIAKIVAGPRRSVGERLTRLFVSTWDREAGRNPIVALLRAAMSHGRAERLLRDFVTNEILLPLARGLQLDHAELRLTLSKSQLLGLGITRYVLRLEPIASLDAEATIAAVAPTIQRYLTGRLPEA